MLNQKKIVKRLLYSAVAIVVICLGWYVASRLYARVRPLELTCLDEVQEVSNDQPRDFVRIALYNIAHGRGGVIGDTNWQKRSNNELLKHLDNIAEQIIDQDVDIVILNEVDFDSAWSHNVNHAGHIARKGGFKYLLQQKNCHASFPFFKLSFGNAVLSMFPITDKTFVKFKPLHRYEDIIAGNHDAALCKIRTPIGDLNLLAVHLDSRDENTRVKCAERIINLAENSPYPFIAAGDFNSTPIGFRRARKSESGQNAMTLLFQEGKFMSYFPQGHEFLTFPSQNPYSMLDWIIGRNIDSFDGSKTVDSHLSDHLMVVTDIKF